MKKNIGNVDRIIRVIVGLAIIAFGVFNQSWWGLVGLIPLATAAVGFCGLYGVCNMSTCQVDSSKPQVK